MVDLVYNTIEQNKPMEDLEGWDGGMRTAIRQGGVAKKGDSQREGRLAEYIEGYVRKTRKLYISFSLSFPYFGGCPG